MPVSDYVRDEIGDYLTNNTFSIYSFSKKNVLGYTIVLFLFTI